MPILNVKALPQQPDVNISAALKEVCAVIADIYGCESKHVWANWTEIKAGNYVEGSLEASEQPQNTHPPIAELICFGDREPEMVERLLKATAKTLSNALGIPNNIFIHYQIAEPGKVIAGDGIIRR